MKNGCALCGYRFDAGSCGGLLVFIMDGVRLDKYTRRHGVLVGAARGKCRPAPIVEAPPYVTLRQQSEEASVRARRLCIV